MIVNKYSGNGGGGGSYTLPVATSNRLGGVKVGSGLSIDASGVLSSAGGSGGYNVVDTLPETGSATEGALYYVKQHIGPVEYRGIAIYPPSGDSTGQQIVHILDGKGNDYGVWWFDNMFFPPDQYPNDGEYHKKSDAEFWFKVDSENKIFNVYLPDDSWSVTLENGATSAETSSYPVMATINAQTYRFDGTGYTVAGGYDDIYIYFDYNDFNNYEKRQALINSISSVEAENRKNIRLFISNFSSEYIPTGWNGLICFVPSQFNAEGVNFISSFLPYRNGDSCNKPLFIECCIIFNRGIFFEVREVPFVFMLNINNETHYLELLNGVSWSTITRSIELGFLSCPIIQLVYNGTIFNAVYKEKNIYLDVKHEGKNLHGVWYLSGSNNNLVEWSEDQVMYQSVSDLSFAGTDTASFLNQRYSVSANAITNLTEETELFIKKYGSAKCRVTTDGTTINIYGEDKKVGWVLGGSGTWDSLWIETTGLKYNPMIDSITTGDTTYSFSFYFKDNMNEGTVVSKTSFYQPTEGLLAFDQSNSSLNLYAGGQWRTIYPQA